jgi:hypothetical protein
MARQDFETVSQGDQGQLRLVELIVLDTHRRLYARQGRPWSEPQAYRWLHYEDPDPVARLSDGLARLGRMGAQPDAEAVDKACAEAAKHGFPY